MKNIFLTIVIPCFNEERNIRLGVLENVYAYLSHVKFTYEVIIVDDGSTDETIPLVEKFISKHKNCVLHKAAHGGKAAAVITGMKKANGNYVLFTDMDQATPLYEWQNLFPWFQKGYDIVIGSRAGVRKGAPFFRKTMAKGFMILRNIFLNLGIEDTQCGFKAFRKNVVANLTQNYSLYTKNRNVSGSMVTAGFDVELLFMAKEMGYSIKEVPVEWHYQETRHVSPIRDSVDGLRDLARIKLNSVKGKYPKKPKYEGR